MRLYNCDVVAKVLWYFYVCDVVMAAVVISAHNWMLFFYGDIDLFYIFVALLLLFLLCRDVVYLILQATICKIMPVRHLTEFTNTTQMYYEQLFSIVFLRIG